MKTILPVVFSAFLILPMILLYMRYFIHRAFTLGNKMRRYSNYFIMNLVATCNFANKMHRNQYSSVEKGIESSVGYCIFTVYFLLGLSSIMNRNQYQYNTKPIYLSFIYLFLSFTFLMMIANSPETNSLLYYTFIGLCLLFILLYNWFYPNTDVENNLAIFEEMEEKSFLREIADIYFFSVENLSYRKKLLYFIFHFPLYLSTLALYYKKISSFDDIILYAPYCLLLLGLSFFSSLFMKNIFFNIYSLLFVLPILLILNSHVIENVEFLALKIFNGTLYRLAIEPFVCGIFDLTFTIYLTYQGHTEFASYYIFYSAIINILLKPGLCGILIENYNIKFESTLPKLAIPFINISVLLIPLSFEASKQRLTFELGFSLLFTYALYIIILGGQLKFYE